MNAIYGKFRKLCHIYHIALWSVHWSVSFCSVGSEVNRANELAKIACCVSNSFPAKLRDLWEGIHKFRVNCLRDTTDVGSAHSLLTRYFSSAWSISFSLILLVSSEIFTLLQVGKFLRENWAGNITMNCSIIMSCHVSLDLFVDFVPFSGESRPLFSSEHTWRQYYDL